MCLLLFSLGGRWSSYSWSVYTALCAHWGTWRRGEAGETPWEQCHGAGVLLQSIYWSVDHYTAQTLSEHFSSRPGCFARPRRGSFLFLPPSPAPKTQLLLLWHFRGNVSKVLPPPNDANLSNKAVNKDFTEKTFPEINLTEFSVFCAG